MITVSNISKSYNARSLFSGINLNIGMRDRIAVIGQNGTGKTTLFEIISGNISPDTGSVNIPKNTTIGYLRQDIQISSDNKLLAEVIQSSSSINSLAHKIKILQEELAETTDNEDIASLLEELGELQHAYEVSGGYDTEYEAEIILSGLGFVESDFTRPLRELTAASRAMARGDLEQSVTVRSQDELGELALAFNQMSAELARANQARRQMTADIAHDLRSPLSVISGYAEALNDGKLPGAPEIYEILHQESQATHLGGYNRRSTGHRLQCYHAK